MVCRMIQICCICLQADMDCLAMRCDTDAMKLWHVAPYPVLLSFATFRMLWRNSKQDSPGRVRTRILCQRYTLRFRVPVYFGYFFSHHLPTIAFRGESFPCLQTVWGCKSESSTYCWVHFCWTPYRHTSRLNIHIIYLHSPRKYGWLRYILLIT